MMKFPTIPMCEQVPCTDSMKGLRAFLYCRVAHDDGISLDLQATELRRFAEQAGFAIAGEAAEYGSGLTLDRAVLKEVTQADDYAEPGLRRMVAKQPSYDLIIYRKKHSAAVLVRYTAFFKINRWFDIKHKQFCYFVIL